jgi:peptidoglycan/xylan/chitin deacetylase (PgdA/CDA1 family)
MLERQVRLLLRRGYRPATLDDVVAARHSAPLLHVTFDDAYRSVLAALPILGRLGVPATIFVCASFAADGRALDIPELSAETRWHAAELATLTWDELRNVVGEGTHVESHTLTHPHLTGLADEELEHELRASREAVQRQLGGSCSYLAYPYGEHDVRVARVAQGVGYRAAFALPGALDGRDAYALPRVGVWRRDGLARFALKTTPLVRRLVFRHPRIATPFRSPKPRPGSAAETTT